jgi:hypothetical protein
MYDANVVAGRIMASSCRVSPFLYHPREVLRHTYQTDEGLPGLIFSFLRFLSSHFPLCPPFLPPDYGQQEKALLAGV